MSDELITKIKNNKKAPFSGAFLLFFGSISDLVLNLVIFSLQIF